ncbi:MAG: acyl-CoA dehydrogenase family protein [Verrucomicrobiales bacterium]
MKTESLIDTSKMSAGQREALELTESARETQPSRRDSLATGLFMGRLDLPEHFPEQSVEDRDQGDAFLSRLEAYLHEHTDPDEIDRTGEIPEQVFEGLSKLGAFGIKIPSKYGGLGLSQTNYCRAAMVLGRWCGNLTALVSAHQSIGVPQPLMMFGTEAQKAKFLPRVAQGEVSAFALTEVNAGSDPATLNLRADPDGDDAFVLNGEKLWCTNGVKAGVIIVMARTPGELRKDGTQRTKITAFIVEMDSPGVEVVTRCHFMGLRALYNGVIRFTNVRVPKENIVLGEGKGLRVALTTLNTGRLTLPGACVGLMRRCLEISRKWSTDRVQWGAPIGKHQAIADKLSKLAADLFALETITLFAAQLVDQDKTTDVRLEAALGKLWGTEQAWAAIDATMQIRGGRGYETVESLESRGEESVPVERLFRDSRINTIFEGSSEIMRLFVAREALDPHLQLGAPVFNSGASLTERGQAVLRCAWFYGRWFPALFIPRSGVRLKDVRLGKAVRRAEANARSLARRLFVAMAKNGPKLEREQLLLGRFVDVAAELYVCALTCLRADQAKEQREEKIELALHFAEASSERVRNLFATKKEGKASYRLSQRILENAHLWLERHESVR